jgi:hypothetical protein
MAHRDQVSGRSLRLTDNFKKLVLHCQGMEGQSRNSSETVTTWWPVPRPAGIGVDEETNLLW